MATLPRHPELRCGIESSAANGAKIFFALPLETNYKYEQAI
jgi:hypothetical protein